MPAKAKKLCFILMPFKDDLKEVYNKAIKPACIKAGFKPLRVDELKGIYNINQQIIEHIFSSAAIIADLTGWNPNVFYELGVAHAIDKKTIMIIKKRTRLPFDIRPYRCILYEHTRDGLKELRGKIAESLESIEEWRKYSSNPVQNFKPRNVFFIRRSALNQLKSELRKKEKQLAQSVPRIEWEALKKHLDQLQTANLILKKVYDLLRYPLANKIAALQPPTASHSLIQLRSEARDNLSYNDIETMIKERNFFENSWNKNGQAMPHLYEAIDRDGARLVIDYTTSLIWQQSGSQEEMNYHEAATYIAGLNQDKVGGYNDWRLPTLEEAMSLMEPEKKQGDLYIDPVFEKTQSWIWTADQSWIWPPDKESFPVIWVVSFSAGLCISRPVNDNRFVRAVR